MLAFIFLVIHVESDAVLDMLREIGVDYAQGYVISKPLSLTELNIQLISLRLI